MSEISFRLQPIYRRGELAAVEALLNHPDPAGLFEAADPEFEIECFQKAVEATRGLPVQVFVNISARALVQAGGRLRPAPNTVLEITERRPAPVEQVRAAVRGMKVSIDDFGSGQSACFLDLRPDYVKIAAPLVCGSSDNPLKKSLLAEFARWRGYGVTPIAEGIETEADFLACLRAGIEYHQGFWLARPCVDWDAELSTIPRHPVHLPRIDGARSRVVIL